jgi:hypothetical protein
MIILTKIKGGLGNQMFQYATGRIISHEANADLFLDTTGFNATQTNTDTVRHFDLEKLNITANTLPYDETYKIKNPLGLFSKALRFFNQKILNKHYFDFEPALLEKAESKISQNKNVYLEGYFQSEKNFAPIRDILLEEFSLKEEFKSSKFKELQSEIQSNNSVSVHVRRGDYVKNPSVTKYHGICSISYYKTAIETIKNRTTNPVLYFFSDDPKWVSENFDLNENAKIISDQNLSAPEELFLMSSCKHNIIANSTFSWWGAWLNQNHDKIVTSPTPWVQFKPNPHPNIIPEAWIKIPKNH